MILVFYVLTLLLVIGIRTRKVPEAHQGPHNVQVPEKVQGPYNVQLPEYVQQGPHTGWVPEITGIRARKVPEKVHWGPHIVQVTEKVQQGPPKVQIPKKVQQVPGNAPGYSPVIAKHTGEEPDEIVWLHIPKCGTTFLNTLYHYACPGIPPSASVGKGTSEIFQTLDLTTKYPMDESWDEICTIRFEVTGLHIRGHDPIRWNTKLENVFAIFREPFDRVVSGFNDYMQLSGKPEHDKKLLWSVLRGQSRKIQFDAYVTFGDQLGCQTKMVVGHYCGSSHVLTDADLQKAKQRIEEMGFIGITGEWNRSICLFHKQFGGKIFDVEYSNKREGQYKNDEFRRVKDTFDDQLYDHVKKLVNQRFLKFGC